MRRAYWILLFVLGFGLAGCAGHRKPLLPVHDEVLVYPLPVDLVYLRTLDAIAALPDWNLETTDKENGVITVRNIRFSSLNDKDQRVVTFLVKRLHREETSVEIAKEHQQVLGSGDLLKVISRQLNREMRS